MPKKYTLLDVLKETQDNAKGNRIAVKNKDLELYEKLGVPKLVHDDR